MKKITAGWTTWILVFAMALASAGELAAHHSLAQFDTTTAVRAKGTVVRFELINPHSILYIDQKNAGGQVQHWAVEGPGVTQLSRSGVAKDIFKVGDIVEACGYVAKDGAELQQRFSGKLMDAETVTLSNGKTQTWSDYGHHLCLGPDYVDHHVK